MADTEVDVGDGEDDKGTLPNWRRVAAVVSADEAVVVDSDGNNGNCVLVVVVVVVVVDGTAAVVPRLTRRGFCCVGDTEESVREDVWSYQLKNM
jgi:hypothetical protein